MMGIRLLAGFLFLIEPSWPPSGLLNDLSGALFGVDGKNRCTTTLLKLL